MNYIPKIIHQTWKTNDVPKKWLKYQSTWKNIPNCKYILWTDIDNRNLIKNKYSWFLKQYDNYKYPIQRADVIRPFILYTYGGIYADMDLEYLNDFWDTLDNNKINIPESPYFFNENIQNIFIACKKKHPELLNIIDYFKKNVNYKHIFKGPEVLNTTGPNIYDKTLEINPNMYNVLRSNKYNPPTPSKVWVLKILNLTQKKGKRKIIDNFNNIKDLYFRHHNDSSWNKESSINIIIYIIIILFVCGFIWIMCNKNKNKNNIN